VATYTIWSDISALGKRDLCVANWYSLAQWFVTWGKFTPGGKSYLPRGKFTET